MRSVVGVVLGALGLACLAVSSGLATSAVAVEILQLHPGCLPPVDSSVRASVAYVDGNVRLMLRRGVPGAVGQGAKRGEVVPGDARTVDLDRGQIRLTVDQVSTVVDVTDRDRPLLLTLAAAERGRLVYAEDVPADPARATRPVRVELKDFAVRAVALDPAALSTILMINETLVPTTMKFRPARVTLPIPRAPSLTDPKEVYACAWLPGAPLTEPGLRVRLAAIQTPSTGPTRIDVELPDGAIGFFRTALWQGAFVAIALADGGFRQIGQIEFMTPIYAVAISVGVTLALTIGFGMLASPKAAGGKRARWPWEALFVGKDGEASISLFQMALWTVVAVWAVIYVYLRTWDLLAMTPAVMALLGFAGATSVLSKAIASRGKAAAGPPAAKPFAWRQLLETDGKFELLKLQLLVFTVMIVLYVIAEVAQDGVFPALDVNFLLLMGVSNGVYLGAKFADPTPKQKAEAQNQVAEQVGTQIADLEAKQKSLREQQAAMAAARVAAATTRNLVAVGTIDLKADELWKDLLKVAEEIKRKQDERAALLEEAKKALAGKS